MFQIHFLSETRKIYCLLFSCCSENLLPRYFQSQLLLCLVLFYNWRNLQASTCVTSLNTSIPTIYHGIPRVSYLVYRGSQQTSCDIWRRSRFKKRFLPTEYSQVIYFYRMTEHGGIKDNDIFGFDMIFRQYLLCDCQFILLTCMCA
jgi:hypothetical protein